VCETNNGFEDREGHQAPFTLRKKENVQRSTPNFQRQATEGQTGERLFEFFNRANDGVEIGPVAGLEFGMEQFPIGLDFEGAAARGNQGKRFDSLTEFEDFCRQTDGFRRVVSNHAVFDRDFGFHPAAPFRCEIIGAIERGQDAVEAAVSAANRLEVQATRLPLQL
jgi:hypothetical protein